MGAYYLPAGAGDGPREEHGQRPGSVVEMTMFNQD
jgi:hypothetical protein